VISEQIYDLIFYLCMVPHSKESVSISPNTFNGFKAHGRFGLISQLDFQVCHQGPLVYLLLVFLVVLCLRGELGLGLEYLGLLSLPLLLLTLLLPCCLFHDFLSSSSLSVFRIRYFLNYMTSLIYSENGGYF
jgi:hypothetical protein